MQFRSAVIAPVLFSLVAGAAWAADHKELTTVEVVQVPVYVTRDGSAVTGLTKGDFELSVNGRPQAIDYFDVVDFGAVPARAASPAVSAQAPASPVPIQQRRLYVLLFDLVYSTTSRISRAQVAADGYVDRAGDADFFAVATYTSNHGIQLMVPFTRDRVVVRRAIQHLDAPSTADPLRLAIEPTERAETVEPDKFAESADVQHFIADSAAAQLLGDPLRRRITDQIENLSALADRLAPIEGNRHVVLLTSGFDTTILHGSGPANTIVMSGSYAKPRQGWVMGMSDPTATHALKDMYARFARAGVFLDCIDVAGNRMSMSSSHESEGLSALARDTGGQVILNRNNLGEAIQHLADLQRVVYVLSFHARNTGREVNAISVKVRNANGAHVTHRPSYSAMLPKGSTTDGLRLADILENDIPQTGVTATISASGQSVDVTIPTRELLALSGRGTAEAEVLLYVYSGRSAVAFKHKKITIDAERAGTEPLHIGEAFDLPPGHYSAKVLLRVEGVDALGFARTEMNIE